MVARATRHAPPCHANQLHASGDANMRMSRESDDFPRNNLPYTVEKLKQRGIVARWFFRAGLWKLERDYLNPNKGDVLASQRRYRRYLAGDKSVVVRASVEVWVAVLSATMGPVLITLMFAGLWVKKELHDYIPARVMGLGSQSASSQGAQAAMPSVVPTTSSDSPAGNPAQSVATASQPDFPAASDAVAGSPQPDAQAQPDASAADANSQQNGEIQQSEAARDLSAKLQAQVLQSEQQYDAGQYENAAATAEAVLEIDPGNISAQRLRNASREELAKERALDAAQAQSVQSSPAGAVAQAVPELAPTPYNPPVAAYRTSPYGWHARGR